MALASAVQGARHTGQAITWQGQDLTGATVTARIFDPATGTARDADGTFNVTDAGGGAFTWAYGAQDLAEAGLFQVQFAATYADTTTDRTQLELWRVERAI